MAKINNTAAYETVAPNADSIVIGSTESDGDTKNFQMSDILTYIMSSSTLTLQDVCDNGTTTSTGITVGGAVTMSAGATINGSGLAVNGSGGILVTDAAGITSAGGPVSGTALNTSGGLLVSGTSLLGEIDSAGPADIADTLTLSKATGTGLQVDANVNVDGTIAVATTFKATPSTVNISVTKPSSSSSSGDAGDIAFDSSYIYVCVGLNSWGRVAIDTTPF